MSNCAVCEQQMDRLVCFNKSLLERWVYKTGLVNNEMVMGMGCYIYLFKV